MFLIIDNNSILYRIRKTMPAKIHFIDKTAAENLKILGQQIRARRKALGINATATAEAAGLSRVTLHRIEKGEPAVTMVAYLNVMAVLNLAINVRPTEQQAAGTHTSNNDEDSIPVRIRLTDYPQLKSLAWQVHGTEDLTPVEALDIYERNARYLNLDDMAPHEQALLNGLRRALAHARPFDEHV